MRPLLLYLIILATAGNLERIKSDHFAVYFEKGSKSVAGLALKSAETAYQRVEKNLGVTSDSIVKIRIGSAGGNFAKDQPAPPGAVPDWAVGTAYPSRGLIYIKHPQGVTLKLEDISEVVTHEFTHIAVGNFLDEVEIPRWLDEGLADFIGGKRSWTASTTIGLASLSGKVIPFERLNRRWPESRSEAQLAYAQSFDFVVHIEKEYGPGALKRILAEIKESKNVDASFHKVTGKHLIALEFEWLHGTVKIYRWIPILSGGVSLWTLASFLVILGYIRKKRSNKLKYQLWELEDKLRHVSATPLKLVEENEDDENPPENTTYH